MYRITLKKEDIGGGFPVITSPKNIVDLFHSQTPADGCQEVLIAFMLGASGKVISAFPAGTGGPECVIIDGKLIACAAVQSLAKSVILVHSHPFGQPVPSKADIAQTSALKKTLTVLGMKLLDHVIVSPEGYFSFAEDKSFTN